MKHIYLFIIAFGMVPLAKAQESNNFTLAQCVDYAYTNHLKIKNAVLDEQIAHKKVQQTLAAGTPQVNANSTFQYFIELPTSFIPDFISPATYGVLASEGVRDRNGMEITPKSTPPQAFPVQFGVKRSLALGLEASQILFSSDYILAIQATKAYEGLNKKNTQASKIEVNMAVSQAYYNVLVNEERSKLLDINIDRVKKTAEDTRAYNKAGFAEKVDADRLEVLYNNLLVEKSKVSRLLNLANSLLKFQMNMDMNAKLTLSQKLTDFPVNPLPALPDSIDISTRIEYKTLQDARKLNQLQLKQYQLGRLPTLVAFGAYSRTAQGNSVEFFKKGTTYYPTALVGLKLSVPILGGFQKTFHAQEARLQLQKTDNNIVQFSQGVNLEVASNKALYDNAEESLRIQKRNMELATEVVRVTKLKYEQGTTSNLELISAESTLKEAQTNYIAALYDGLTAKLNLDRALGEIQ